MPKIQLSTAEKISRYKRKISELEKTEAKKRRRVVVYSDDSDNDPGGQPEDLGPNNLVSDTPFIEMETEAQPELVDAPTVTKNTVTTLTAHTLPAPTPLVASTAPAVTTASTVSTTAPSITPTDTSAPATSKLPSILTTSEPAPASATLEPPMTVESSLDPALLAALGESTSDSPEFGPSIHDSLANLWLPLLKKGMTKENKEKLLKEYLIPSNCKLLQAPKLNAEISAAVSEVVRGRDKKYTAVQQQLGQGITAVNRALDVMLKSDNKPEAIKHLSDGCRILSDLHNFYTKDRIKLVTPSLEKNFLHVIQDADRDESLFGNTLSEKIKASKAIEKQGQQIKKTVATTKANTPSTTNTRPSTSQGNWSGPPRYSSNRGGRGGGRRTDPAPATRRPYMTTTAQTKSPAQNKTRAPARQQ